MAPKHWILLAPRRWGKKAHLLEIITEAEAQGESVTVVRPKDTNKKDNA